MGRGTQYAAHHFEHEVLINDQIIMVVGEALVSAFVDTDEPHPAYNESSAPVLLCVEFFDFFIDDQRHSMNLLYQRYYLRLREHIARMLPRNLNAYEWNRE